MDGDRITRLLDTASYALIAFGLALVAVWLIYESGLYAAMASKIASHREAISDLAKIRRMWGE